MSIWPPPITGQRPPDETPRAPKSATKRGFAVALCSALFLGVGLLHVSLSIGVLYNGLCLSMLVGVALSVTDLRNCRKAADIKGMVWNCIGILCNLLPFVFLTIAGILTD